MKSKDLSIYLGLLILGLATMASSCKDESDEPDFPPLDKGNISANRFVLSFSEVRNRDSVATYEFYAPNGNITTADTVKLRKSNLGGFVRYESSIEIFKDNDTVTDNVKALGDRYIICYRNIDDKNLRVGDFDKDANGVSLGTTAFWSTLDESRTDGTGTIRITMNYQSSGKEGLCDPGSRILEGSLPYKITN